MATRAFKKMEAGLKDALVIAKKLKAAKKQPAKRAKKPSPKPVSMMTLPLQPFLDLRTAAIEARDLLERMKADGSARLPCPGFDQAIAALSRTLKATNPAEAE